MKIRKIEEVKKVVTKTPTKVEITKPAVVKKQEPVKKVEPVKKQEPTKVAPKAKKPVERDVTKMTAVVKPALSVLDKHQTHFLFRGEDGTAGFSCETNKHKQHSRIIDGFGNDINDALADHAFEFADGKITKYFRNGTEIKEADIPKRSIRSWFKSWVKNPTMAVAKSSDFCTVQGVTIGEKGKKVLALELQAVQDFANGKRWPRRICAVIAGNSPNEGGHLIDAVTKTTAATEWCENRVKLHGLVS